MKPLFYVQTSPHFERSFKKLKKQHPDLTRLFAEVLEILETDPYNRTRRHQIKKLTDPQQDGQYRLRLGLPRLKTRGIENDYGVTVRLTPTLPRLKPEVSAHKQRGATWVTMGLEPRFKSQPDRARQEEIHMRTVVGLVIVCCLAVGSSSAAAGLDQQPGGQETDTPVIAGTVDSVPGSPVVLSDARFSMPPSNWQPGAVKLAGKVRIENVSGKEITRLHLLFHYVGGPAGDTGFGDLVWTLAPGATVEEAQNNANVKGPEGVPALSVSARGAAFADGSYWAAPRTPPRLLFSTFLPSQNGAELTVADCKIDGQSYTASLKVQSPHIVAYRLGMVKDTPATFQVTVGHWVDIDEGHRRYEATVIDSGQSLRGTRLFERESEPFICRGKEVARLPAGVAIFVAAVAYDDGRVWEQDTARDALFWNNLY